MQKAISFFKYHGTGNDFILIDSFTKDIKLSTEIIQEMCHRRYGIGADGLMILRKHKDYDFEMDFYNSDGKPGSMCGNGGRCIVAFAHDLDIIKKDTCFIAPDGEHFATYHSADKISLKMNNVSSVENHELGLFLDTGSPHLVISKEIGESLNVYQEGKKIRNSKDYAPWGTNINFYYPDKDIPEIFTYERGVENETYSCGTGAVATALTYHIKTGALSPIHLKSKGGLLKVSFVVKGKNNFSDIWLEGPAKKTFTGLYNIIE